MAQHRVQFIRFGGALALSFLAGACAGTAAPEPAPPLDAAIATEVITTSESPSEPFVCRPTRGNGEVPPAQRPSANHYGNDAIWTAHWGGTVVFEPGGPGQYTPGGPLAMKWPWWRATPGVELTIEGRRLDAPAPPLEALFPAGYDGQFTPSTLVFSTPGCWEVTASTIDGTLTFITLVVKVE